MFRYRQIRKAQYSFIKWKYSSVDQKRKICSVCGTLSSVTLSGTNCSLRQASAAAPASYCSSKFGAYFTHNRKYTSIRRSSSASAGNVDEYDYIIVGAGSAGCVLANRLAGSDQRTKVLLVEAGPPADKNWKVRMPAALMYCLKNPRYSWCYESVPQKATGIKFLSSHSIKFLVPSARVDAYRFSFFPVTITLWNSLPTDVVLAPSVESFKNRVAAVQLAASTN